MCGAPRDNRYANVRKGCIKRGMDEQKRTINRGDATTKGYECTKSEIGLGLESLCEFPYAFQKIEIENEIDIFIMMRHHFIR